MHDVSNISLDVQAKIEQLEKLILEQPQVLTPVKHEFCNGVYARTMFIPKDTVLTGAIHRDENFLLIRIGLISVWTEDGMKQLKAGDMVLSKAGLKRVGFAHSDTTLTTFHANPTNEKDPETLWEMYTVPASELLDSVQLELIGV